jgi:predicted nucleic acid-binding Zn ribbon protein
VTRLRYQRLSPAGRRRHRAVRLIAYRVLALLVVMTLALAVGALFLRQPAP